MNAKPTIESNGDGTWTIKWDGKDVTVVDEDEAKDILKPYDQPSDDECKAVAEGIFRGEIFSSWHISRPEELGMVFMIMMFMGQTGLAKMAIHDINFIYEYMSKASPTAINGMPTFFSAHMMDRAHEAKVMKHLKDLEDNAKKMADSGRADTDCQADE
jgi:hypothetical protein